MAEVPERDRWWLVVASGLAVFMALLDTFVVSVALPVIATDLGATPAVAEWVVLGYLVPMVALALPSGRWLDRVDLRAALTLACGGFAVASVGAGLAPGMGWLVAARLVQGTFAAVLFALTPTLATLAVRPVARGRAMAVVTTLGPVGGIAGPPLGGFLTASLGWPWIFYLNVPVSLAVIAIGLAQLPGRGSLRLPDRAWVAETALLGGAVAVLVLGVSLASHDPRWLVLAAASVPALLAWRRLRSSRQVRDLWRNSGVARPLLTLLATATAFGGVMLLVPFYLQQVRHADPTAAGLAMLASPVAMALTAPVSGALADRWGGQRVAVAGAGLMAAGLFTLAPLGEGWAPGEVAWRLALVGGGGALFNTANLAVLMSHAPRHLVATTGAASNFVRQLGHTLGPALATLGWALPGYTVGGMRAAVAVAGGFVAVAAVPLVRARATVDGSATDSRSLVEQPNPVTRGGTR